MSLNALHVVLALLLGLLLVPAAVKVARTRRSLDQLPAVLFAGTVGAGVPMILGPIWDMGWLVDIGFSIAALTGVVLFSVARRAKTELH